VSGATAIGQPPLINMMAGKARPLSSLVALSALFHLVQLFRSVGDMCSFVARLAVRSVGEL
jgi:hypothetical protein